MTKKTKISVVSYSNTLPFKYGIEKSDYLKKNSSIYYDNPSECADKLINNRADIGLIPITGLLQHKNLIRITDFGLASKEKVKSVFIFSEKSLENIENIILDYQSLTSVYIAKILAKFHFKQSFNFIPGQVGYENEIKGKTAGVVIGDRAIKLKKQFNHSYDLAEEWNNFTSLPAVFAVWAANKNINKDFLSHFNDSLKYGVENLNVVAEENKNAFSYFDLKDYLQNCIEYKLSTAHLKSIELFNYYMQKVD